MILGDNIMKIIENVVKTNRKRNYSYDPLGENIMEIFGFHIERLGVPCRNFCYHEVKHMERRESPNPI